MTTKDMEKALFKRIRKLGTYICFEVAMPCEYRYSMVKERVDCLSYNTKNEWRFYELKLTKNDFYSKCKHTFYGNYNYYVMPLELYPMVKRDIPKVIGVYVINQGKACCYKKPIKQKLMIDEENLKFNFMQALYREYEKIKNKELLEMSI